VHARTACRPGQPSFVLAAEVRRMSEDATEIPTCDRRSCDERAAFHVLERYLEDTGKGPVEARTVLCRAHTDEESPVNLDAAYPEYVFRVEPISDAALDATE